MSSWTGKSRGTLLGHKIVVVTLQYLGLSKTYLLVKLISFYFYLFAASPKKAILDFYQYQLGYGLAESKNLCRKNFNILAQSLLDKIALLTGRGEQIHYTQQGEEELLAWAKSGKGGFLYSAHVGNWAVAGNLLKSLDIKVNVLMLENEEENLRGFLESQKAVAQFKVISIKEDMSHLVEIYKAIKAGEFVCINADRFLEGSKTIELDFFNGKALFPEGPFLLAEKLKTSYSFVFAVKESKFGYAFSSTTLKSSKNGAEGIAKEYVLELEKIVKKHPEQWFNYYNFMRPQT